MLSPWCLNFLLEAILENASTLGWFDKGLYHVEEADKHRSDINPIRYASTNDDLPRRIIYIENDKSTKYANCNLNLTNTE